MNPYDFVRIDWNAGVERHSPTAHDHFEGISGLIDGKITVLTPLFIRDPRGAKGQSGALPFARNQNGRGEHIIPGSTLKGAIRSLVEVISPGCFLLFDRAYSERSWPTSVNYSSKLDREFRRCKHPARLCSACRMFGVLVESRDSDTGEAFSWAGNVGFEDGNISRLVKMVPVYTPNLLKPRSYHEPWYLSGDRMKLAGRKFYFHQDPDRLYLKSRLQNYGQYVEPVGIDSTFTFSARFENLSQDDFSLLLYALALEKGMRHKIGYAKPAGLGSVEIALTRIETIDMQRRYTSPDGGKTVYEGDALQTYVGTQTQRFTTDRTSITLNDLRRIWQWPPPQGVKYGYPTPDWFNNNRTAPISATLNAPS